MTLVGQVRAAASRADLLEAAPPRELCGGRRTTRRPKVDRDSLGTLCWSLMTAIGTGPGYL
jgi:hypothetical protein